MSVPTYDQFIEPLLRYLATKPGEVAAAEAHEAAATALSIGEQDKLELLPSGTQPVYKNRAGWAHDRLKRAGLSRSPRRGYWQVTDQGRVFVAAHPAPLAPKETEQLAVGFMDVRLRPPPTGESLAAVAMPQLLASPSSLSSPDDRLGEALSELRRSVAGELLETLAWATGPAGLTFSASAVAVTAESTESFPWTSLALRRSTFMAERCGSTRNPGVLRGARRAARKQGCLHHHIGLHLASD
jgi:restriction endonuclease Mrr